MILPHNLIYTCSTPKGRKFQLFIYAKARNFIGNFHSACGEQKSEIDALMSQLKTLTYELRTPLERKN